MTITSKKPIRSLIHCSAIRCNDQMQCECGLTWDINDDDLPPCPRELADPFAEIKKTLEQ